MSLLQGVNGEIQYTIEDPFKSFGVDKKGNLFVARELDREGRTGPYGTIKVIAKDRGHPSKSSQISIDITLLDVNDCAPRIHSSTVLHVKENSEPKK